MPSYTLKDIYFEYDNILVGNYSGFSDRFFGEYQPRNEKNAVAVIRYALIRYLGWDANTALAKLDEEIIRKMKLYPLMKYIEYPIEFDKSTDYEYLVSLVFPSKKIDLTERTIHIFKNIIESNAKKFPKNYFLGTDGIVRACLCLRYIIANEIMISDTEDLYVLFASGEGYNLLRKYKLLSACQEIFDTPVDYIHMALPSSEKSEFLYRYYKYKYITKFTNENGRKIKQKNAIKLGGNA